MQIAFDTRTKFIILGSSYILKLAEAIGYYLHIQAQNIAENPVLPDIDLHSIVGCIYGGISISELLEYIKKIEGISDRL